MREVRNLVMNRCSKKKKMTKYQFFGFWHQTNYKLGFRHKLERQTSFCVKYHFCAFHLEPNYTNSKEKDGNNALMKWKERSISRNNKTHFSNWHQSFFARKHILRKDDLVKMLYSIEFVSMLRWVHHSKWAQNWIN